MVVAARAQGVDRLDHLAAAHPRPVRHAARDYQQVTGGEQVTLAGDREVELTTEDSRDLLLGVLVLRKDGAGLVAIADDDLVLA